MYNYFQKKESVTTYVTISGGWIMEKERNEIEEPDGYQCVEENMYQFSEGFKEMMMAIKME